MGVSGLTAFIKDNRNSVAHTVQLAPRADPDAQQVPPHALVVDAWSFIYSLYAAHIPTFSGGEYRAFYTLITRVCTAWARVGIQPYFVFDGPTPPSKRPLVQARLEKRLQTARLFYRTSPASRSSPHFSADALVLPPFAYHVARDALAHLGVPAYHLVEGEADGYCAALADELGAWVLSGDSDFAVFRGSAGGSGGGEACGYRGWVPIDSVQWLEARDGARDTTEAAPEDDGFAVVKKGRAREGKATTGSLTSLLPPRPTTPNAPHPTLLLTVIRPADLAARLRIPPTHLPLFATLAGSDHTPPTAPALFFDAKAGAVERIEKVARVLREALSPLGQERMRKQLRLGRAGAGATPSPGSPRGGLDPGVAQSPALGPARGTPLIAGDHAEAFVSHVVGLMLAPSTAPSRRSAQRVPPEVEARLVQDIIEATCHYILPASPAAAEDGTHGHAHCCATFPFCTCGTGTAPPSVAQTHNCERYARARQRGLMSSFSAYADPNTVWLHTGVEDPEGTSPRGTAAARTRRRRAWEVVVDGVGGLPGLKQGGYQRVDEVAPDLDLDAAEPEIAQDGPPADGDNTDETAVSSEEAECDLATGPRVVEYLRVGASTHLGPVDLDVTERDGAAAILESPRAEQVAYLTAALCAVGPEQGSSPPGGDIDTALQPLVAILRSVIVQAHQEGKPWQRQEVHAAVRAGVASLDRWSTPDVAADETTIEHPTLETKHCVHLSQVVSVALDADQLSQALLLSADFDDEDDQGHALLPPAYQYLDGSLWHLHFLEDQRLGEQAESNAARCLSAVGRGLAVMIKGWGESSASATKSNRRLAKAANGRNGKGQANGGTPSRYGLLFHA